MTNELMWNNPKLPHFLGLPIDTVLAREAAAIFCERTVFEIYGIEHVETFLNTPFQVPGFLLHDHIRALTIIWRPRYWDLPEFSEVVVGQYDKLLSYSMCLLEHELEFKRNNGFGLAIVMVLKTTLDGPMSANIKFCRWLEVMIPPLVRFRE